MAVEDAGLAKLAKKLEICDACEDAEERRQFVAKHAKAAGQSVAVVLEQLRSLGVLSEVEVRDWDLNCKDEALTIVLLPDLPPTELRPAVQQRWAVSAAHRLPAGSEERLRSLLAARDLPRLSALLEDDNVHGEWLAEYAQAQLGPASHCISEPAWVAWADWQPDAATAAGDGDGDDADDGDDDPLTPTPRGELVLLLNAQDQTAARRGLLALELRRAATVHVVAWPRPWLPLLARLARELQRELHVEAEGGESERGEAVLRVVRARGFCVQARRSCSRCGPDLPAAARPGGTLAARGECWVRLTIPSNDAAAEQGAAAAAARAEASLSVLRELSGRLRQRDPEARVEAAPDGPTGRFTINHVSYNGRKLRWVGKVDGDTDAEALERFIETSCSGCC